ncbi:MAG TPA: hypothetical protein VLD58_11895 [Gemmatimonadales bacterium]|nr:hypothetical protein [Gemmatimonadales bacterium]
MRRSLQLSVLLLLLQLGLGALLLTRGFPYFGSRLVDGASWWELPVAIYHLPAIQALSAVGLCCGFGNGMVLPSRVIGGHIPMHLSGTLLLALTNWFCWSVVTLLLYWLWWVRRAPAQPAPVADQAAE